MKIKLSLLICLLLPFSAWSQKEKINTKEGNDDYASGRYEEAIKDYTKALENDPEYMEALFNTGNALQQLSRRLQEQAQNATSEEEKKKLMEGAKTASDKAASQFASVAKMAKTNDEINKAQYNLGNSRLMSGEVEASIEAYKAALRKMPGDDDARYNLAYAQHLKKQQQQQQQQQQDQQDQQDKEKKEQEQNQDQQKQEQQQQQEQQEPQQLSKEEAEQLLQALMKQEKDLQEDLKKKKKQKAQRIKIEKDW